MDNSSLIPYYNTQSELNLLIFGEIMYYQSNNLTTRARSISQFLFVYSGLFDLLPVTNIWVLLLTAMENFIPIYLILSNQQVRGCMP
jgi:hypothetical protein